MDLSVVGSVYAIYQYMSLNRHVVQLVHNLQMKRKAAFSLRSEILWSLLTLITNDVQPTGFLTHSFHKRIRYLHNSLPELASHIIW